MNFHKYQALGNTYLIIESETPLTADIVRMLCNVNYGIGADGILVDLPHPEDNLFHVAIYNPDGSEAEKSGNGLRIFARYLWDELLVAGEPFTIVTKGGKVTAQILDNGRFVHLEMGQVSFYANGVSTNGSHISTSETITLNGRTFELYRADIGNPHCVIVVDDISAELAREYGPLIEKDGRFPNRTNVQFMRILDPHQIQIEIWERGAGYTLASGSSSCAAAAVAHRLGRCAEEITVHMPGGQLDIHITPHYAVSMCGPVTKICSGSLSLEALSLEDFSTEALTWTSPTLSTA